MLEGLRFGSYKAWTLGSLDTGMLGSREAVRLEGWEAGTWEAEQLGSWLDWSSNRTQRVVRSTLAAEAQAADRAVEIQKDFTHAQELVIDQVDTGRMLTMARIAWELNPADPDWEGAMNFARLEAPP